MSSLLTYLLPSVTMTTVYHLLKYVILAFPFSPFSKTRFNWTVQYSEDPELNSVIWFELKVTHRVNDIIAIIRLTHNFPLPISSCLLNWTCWFSFLFCPSYFLLPIFYYLFYTSYFILFANMFACWFDLLSDFVLTFQICYLILVVNLWAKLVYTFIMCFAFYYSLIKINITLPNIVTQITV